MPHELVRFNAQDKTLAIILTLDRAQALLELLQIANDPKLADLDRQISTVLPKGAK